MTDEQRMLADMAQDLFSALGSTAKMDTDWEQIEAVALTGVLVDENKGGFGGSWADALIVIRLAGFHALSLPVPEAIIAAAITERIKGRGTIASGTNGTISGGKFTGEISGICYGANADYLVAPSPIGRSMVIDLASTSIISAQNIAAEEQDNLMLDEVLVQELDANVFEFGALARVAQTAGAMDAALEKSVQYANERQQFGRPLSKFQAVQQSLATFACEAAATNCAAMGAAQAMDDSKLNASYEIACAKIRANRAIGHGTSLSHQVHGAIGFTEEYSLHPLTRRLWGWRSEFGNDAYWTEQLGQKIVARGADQFWADLTAL